MEWSQGVCTSSLRDCIIFQQNKLEFRYPAGLLQSLSIPKQKWDKISMDFSHCQFLEFTHPELLLQSFSIPKQTWDSISMEFITRFPKVQGKECIYVVVDKLTKYAHFFSIPLEYNTSQVADLFFREVFRLHGLPRNIDSDRDRRFLNVFWEELFRLSAMELKPITSYHP
jgi:hypothetical protein